MRTDQGAYAVLHVSSGAAYIGASKNMVLRWTHHRFVLRRNQHACNQLQKLWNRTSEKEWVFVELARQHNIRNLARLEVYWLHNWPGRVLNTQLNGTPLGMKDSNRTRRLKSIAAIRVGTDPAERKRRSIRAKLQHEVGNFGRQTWRS